MFITKCFGANTTNGKGQLFQTGSQNPSLQKTSCKSWVFVLLLIGFTSFLGAKFMNGMEFDDLKIWDGRSFSIYDNHKSDQTQIYPDEVLYLKHRIVVGNYGAKVDGVVLIDEEPIADLIHNWLIMYSTKDLIIADEIFTNPMTYFIGGRSYSCSIEQLSKMLKQGLQNPNFGLKHEIVQITGFRGSNDTVIIDLWLRNTKTPSELVPMRFHLLFGDKGWKINSHFHFSLSDIDTHPVFEGYTFPAKNAAAGKDIQNLLLNGDFSERLEDWMVVDYTYGAQTELVTIDGNNCVKLKHQNERDWNAIGQEIRHKLKRGQLYKISLRYKANSVEDTVPLNVRFGDPSLLMHSSTIAPYWNGQFVNNDNTWREATGYFRVQDDFPDASEPMLDIIFDYGSAGTIWLDDISITPID